MLSALLNKSCFDISVLEKATEIGDYIVYFHRLPAHVLKWYVDKYGKPNYVWDRCISLPFDYNTTSVEEMKRNVEMYVSLGISMTVHELERALDHDDHLFKWMYHKVESPYFWRILPKARLDIVKWLMVVGADLGDITQGLSEEVKMYFVEKGMGHNREMLYYSLCDGQYKVSRYLLEKGVKPKDYDAGIMLGNERCESLELLKEFGYLPDEKEMLNMARDGSIKGIEWLLSNNIGELDDKVVEKAVENCKLDLLKWLKGKGIMPKKNFYVHMYEGHHCYKEDTLSTFKWLEDNGYTFSCYHANEAYLSNNLPLLIWLAKRGILPEKRLERYYDNPCRGCCSDEPSIKREVGEWLRTVRKSELN